MWIIPNPHFNCKTKGHTLVWKRNGKAHHPRSKGTKGQNLVWIKMEKLTVCWARALAAALNSDSVRMSLPRKKSYSKRIKMKWTKKKVWPSPHLALVCISLPIDSTVRLILGIARLIFWYSSSRRGRQQIPTHLHCAHRLPFWWFVDEFPSLAFLKRWFMIFPFFCQDMQSIITPRHAKGESKTVFQYWWKTLHSTHFRRASHLGEKQIHIIVVNFLIDLSCMSFFELEQSPEKSKVSTLILALGDPLAHIAVAPGKCFTFTLSGCETVSSPWITQPPLLWSAKALSKQWCSHLLKVLKFTSKNAVNHLLQQRFIEYLVHSIIKHCQ